jgi:Ca2+-transporting ATPase
MEAFYNKKAEEVLNLLRTTAEGLSEAEATERLKEYGPNKLPEAKRETFLTIFLKQFASPLIYVLFGAAAIVFYLGEETDGLIILFVVFFNSLVGAIQEGRAQNTLQALRQFVETNATVLRNGKELIIRDAEIVPGDIIVIQEGEKIPADARILISRGLRIDESSLTGESAPIDKHDHPLVGKEISVANQKNMVFKGTNVVGGNGIAVVTATGLNTEIGKISKELVGLDTEIPLKKDIRNLSRLIVLAISGVSVFIFLIGLVFGKSIVEMFATVVSLAVSIIPEGLPIALTIVLATGVWRMSKRNALIKKLQAVEALGQAQVIAVDKTGTLTRNEMVIRRVFINGKFFEIGGVGYEPRGEITLDKKPIDPLNHPDLIFAGRIAAFCAEARVVFLEELKMWRVAGDPTEAAMIVFAEKLGFRKNELELEAPKLAEVPFDYEMKYHLTSHRVDDRQFVTIAGAPEVIIPLSHKLYVNGSSIVFSKENKNEKEKIFHKFSEAGLRVIAFGFAELPLGQELSIHNINRLQNLVFVGFYCMEDSLRPEVLDAMKRTEEAGIRVVMITGDHRLTAQAIAKEAGIFKKGDKIMTGEDVEKISVEELAKELPRVSVFARVTPNHKIKIIKAFRSRGEIVAMTGDGVNDAPSLVAADLGVAMGKIGTEVAKEAADIVLLDDNFGSIVAAVEEGRNIYKTIKKTLLYLFSTNIGELLTILGAIFLGFPIPLLPAQIIWLNLITDTFQVSALAMEPKEDNLLKRKFKKTGRYLVDKLMVERMAVMVAPMMIGTLYLFSRYYETNLQYAWTVSLTVLAAFQWLNAWNCRHEDISIFNRKFFSNKYLIAATAVVILLQLVALYTPFMQEILRTEPLAIKDWGITLVIALSIVIAEEIRKFIRRRYRYSS